MNKFLESQFGVKQVDEFQTKANSYDDLCWVSVSSYLSLRISNKREFLWRHFLNLSSNLSKFTNFAQNQIFMKTFLESQFEVIQVYHFQTKANSYEDISWVAVWSYVILWISNKRFLMKTFVESQFEVMYVYEFQKKANSYEDISWVSVWSYGSLWLWNKSEFLSTRLLTRSLKLFKLMCFNQNLVLMKTFLESEFEVM